MIMAHFEWITKVWNKGASLHGVESRSEDLLEGGRNRPQGGTVDADRVGSTGITRLKRPRTLMLQQHDKVHAKSEISS